METIQMRRLHAALQDGLAHGSRIEPGDPRPGEAVTLLFSSNAATPIDQVAVYYTTNGAEPRGQRGCSASSKVILAQRKEIIYDQSFHLLVQHWQAIIPGQCDRTLVRYRADGWSQHEPHLHWHADSVDPVSIPPDCGRLYAYQVDCYATPEWVEDSVIYQIFVDRFRACSDKPLPGSSQETRITERFGGTLRGIIEKLGYLQTLGINCLYLSPIFASPSYHGYDTANYYEIDAHYGGNDTLRLLIDEAHKMGMRVILDFVANHTSDRHPFFLEAINTPGGAKTRWYGFDRDQPHGYYCFWTVQSMPELRTEQPEVQHYLINVALHWLRNYQIDGLRLDYVLGPPHAFWALLYHAVKQQFPQALLLGETLTSLDEIAAYSGRMDTFMECHLTELLQKVFASRSLPLADLLSYLEERPPLLPERMTFVTMLDNHDMDRFLWLAGGNGAQLALAAICHMTLEGIPLIYYGTEVGLSQKESVCEDFAYARAPMIWDDRQDCTLFDLYRRLIALRSAYLVLRRGQWKKLAIELKEKRAFSDNTCQIGAYLRWIDQEFLVVILNNALADVHIGIRLVEQLYQVGIIMHTSVIHDLLNAENGRKVLVIDGTIELHLPPLGAVLLGVYPDKRIV